MNMKTVFIYGLIDPKTNELRYIGKSINPKVRLRKHISERNNHDSYKDRWVRKIYNSGFKPELIIIDEVLKSEWQFWEQHYIAYYKMLGSKLTNGTIGGDQPPSTKGRKHRDESKKKMSESKKGKPIPWLNNGKPRSKTHKKNLSESLKGRKSEKKNKKYYDLYGKDKTKKIIKKMSESHKGLNSGENHPMYGKTHTEETKEKISNKLKGPRPHKFKRVIQCTLDGDFIKEWDSIKSATIELKINNISACCSGKLKTAGGYIWYFKNKNDE